MFCAPTKVEAKDEFRSLRGSVFVIEGVIGAGKTTLGKSLESYCKKIGLNACFYREYVNLDLLNQYIGDMKRYAYTFQMIMLCKRIEIYRDAERFAAGGGIAFVDRSLLGDKTFARMQKDNGNFTQQEWDTYCSMARQEVQLRPDACLFLRCSPETSLRRVKVRGIQSEIKGYSPHYMIQLQLAYDESLKEEETGRLVEIAWDDKLVVDENGLLSSEETAAFLRRLL